MTDPSFPEALDGATPLEHAIEAQELLRGQVPDAVIDAAIASLKVAVTDAATGAAPVAARRRFVTVLFADLVGFTQYAEGRDPEFVATAINELWDAVDAEIIRFGGRVDKHMGDAVMGVWGTEIARENDAEMAVRAALALRRRFDEFIRERDADLDMRVGVGTGYAFFSAIGASGEWSVTGDTVNTASRMEHAAPRGGILVTDSTQALLGNTFVTEAVPHFEVKGKQGMVGAHLVLDLRASTDAVESSVSAAPDRFLIGRAREIARLREAFEASRSGRPTSVVLSGEAGVGKSALVVDYVRWLESLESPPLILPGRSLEFSQTQALAVIRDILWRQLRIAEDDPIDITLDRIERAFDGLGPNVGLLVARWLGVDAYASETASLSGSELAATARVHVRRWIERLAPDRGVVIVVEDLQWADAESLAALHELEHAGSSGVTIVGTTRSSGQQLDSERGPAEVLPVLPLSDGAMKELLMMRFGRSDVATDLLDRIVEITHGNPLHAEEIVRSVIAAEGTPGPDARNTDVVVGVDIPTSLAGAFQTRIDALGSVDRKVLQCASVIGRRFWNLSVAALLLDGSTLTVEQVDESLAELERMNVIARRNRSAFHGCDEFRFHHGLMRNAAYQTVLLDDRRRYHAGMIDWFAERTGERATEFAGEIADHLIGADDRDRAVAVLADTAGRALTTGALKSAMTVYQRALDVRGDDPPDARLVELLMRFGWARHLAGSATNAELMLDEASGLADVLGLTDLGRQASLYHARALMGLGRWDDAAAVVTRLSESAVDLEPRADAELELARAALAEARGDAGAGLEHYERAVDVTRAHQLDDLLIRALGETSWSLTRLGRFGEALAYDDEGFEIARRTGNLERQASLIMNQAVMSHLAASEDPSEFERAIAKYHEAAERFDDLGSTAGRLRAHGNLAQAELETGEIDSASRRALDVLDEAWEAELAIEWGLGLIVLAQIELVTGDVDVGFEILGVLVNDDRLERWDEQIERTLEMSGLDPAASWPRIRAVRDVSAEDVIARLTNADDATS